MKSLRTSIGRRSRGRRGSARGGIGARGGMTLMELLIGLAITAVVSAVIAILINSTAVGTNRQQDGRRALVKMQSIKAYVGDSLANSRCILDVGSNYVVYWTGDQAGAVTPVNKAVNLSELRLLEVDTGTGNLNLYSVQWPSSFSSSDIINADTTYGASSSWYATAQAAKSGGYFVPTVVATKVTGLSGSLDALSATGAKMINLVVTFNDGVASRQVVITADLNNPVAPQ